MADFFKKNKSYIISILISLGVGVLSAIFTMGNMNIGEVLVQPPLAPPAIVFPIVWTVLFILMGISAAMVYENKSKNLDAARSGLTYYAMSLVVNFSWSVIFFNFKALFIASLWIVLLLFLIIMTAVEYSKVVKLAAYLQIPYIIWVSFATYLTFGIYILNM